MSNRTTLIIAAIALLAIGIAPAFAGDNNGKHNGQNEALAESEGQGNSGSAGEGINTAPAPFPIDEKQNPEIRGENLEPGIGTGSAPGQLGE